MQLNANRIKEKKSRRFFEVISHVSCYQGKRSYEEAQNSRQKLAICDTKRRAHSMFCPVSEPLKSPVKDIAVTLDLLSIMSPVEAKIIKHVSQ